MRARLGWLFVFLAGCGEVTPPLDELPLRDTLQASPDVVASLPDSARGRLAARFALANDSDVAADTIAPPEGAAKTPATLVRALDAQRAHRSSDPLIVGEIDDGAARPLRNLTPPVGTPSLPTLEGEAATPTTAALEARGLESDAGRSLSALMATSRAVRLQRVTGWPVGAVAIGDTIYVNAAWLSALAPSTSGEGGSSGASFGTGATPPTSAVAVPPVMAAAAAATTPPTLIDAALNPDAGSVPESGPDAGMEGSAGGNTDAGFVGVLPPVSSSDGGQPPPPPTTGSDDSCAASLDACSACAASSDDSGCGSSNNDSGCDSSNDDSGCDSSNDDSGCDSSNDDSCENTDSSGEQCSVSGRAVNRPPYPRRERPRRSGTLAVLMAPLAFLLKQRRT